MRRRKDLMKENIAKSKLGFIRLLAAQPPIPSPGGRYAPTALKQSDKLHFAHWRKKPHRRRETGSGVERYVKMIVYFSSSRW